MAMTPNEKKAQWDEEDRQDTLAFEKEIKAIKGLVDKKIEEAKRGAEISGEIGLSKYFKDSFRGRAMEVLFQYYDDLGWVFTCNFTSYYSLRWEVKAK